MKRYAVVDVFATLQGEGFQVGVPAVFVRFVGCNMWSGYAEDRERDADRSGAKCPIFCDTYFARGEKLTIPELYARMVAAAVARGMPRVPLVVFTGGEPLLQMDGDLLDRLRTLCDSSPLLKDSVFALETNGSVPLRDEVRMFLKWIAVSPKLPDKEIVVRTGAELRVVFPDYDPTQYVELAFGFPHRYVSPRNPIGHEYRADGEQLIHQRPALHSSNTEAAIAFCFANPRWKLSLQTHKVTGLP